MDRDPLFSEDEDAEEVVAASLQTSNIPGLTIFRNLISEELQSQLIQDVAERDYFSNGSNQVMLWDKDALDLAQPIFNAFLVLIMPLVPTSTYQQCLAMSHSLQVIVNLYHAGQGISPHTDLPHRYGPVVLGISLLGSAVIEFSATDISEEVTAIFLKPGDVYLMTGNARYKYQHGIPARMEDSVSFPLSSFREKGRKTHLTVPR